MTASNMHQKFGEVWASVFEICSWTDIWLFCDNTCRLRLHDDRGNIMLMNTRYKLCLDSQDYDSAMLPLCRCYHVLNVLVILVKCDHIVHNKVEMALNRIVQVVDTCKPKRIRILISCNPEVPEIAFGTHQICFCRLSCRTITASTQLFVFTIVVILSVCLFAMH